MIAYLNGIFSGIRMHLFLSPPDAKNRTRILLAHLEDAVWKCLYDSDVLKTTEFRREVFSYTERQFDEMRLHFKIKSSSSNIDTDDRIIDVLCKLIKTRDSGGISYLQELMVPPNKTTPSPSSKKKGRKLREESSNILTIPADADRLFGARRYL